MALPNTDSTAVPVQTADTPNQIPTAPATDSNGIPAGFQPGQPASDNTNTPQTDTPAAASMPKALHRL